MYRKSALLLTLLPELLAARSIGNTFSRRGVDCSFSIAPSTGDTCETFADSWGIDVDDLKSLNPDLDCSKFDEETEYCVSGEANDDEPTKTTTTSTAPETTTGVTTSNSTKTTEAPSTTSSASDYEPTQPGLSESCDKFHKVVDGDSCDAIEASAGITHSQFSKWNPYINDKCSNIWLDYYVCIHVLGATTTSAAPTPTDDGKPPTQSGIAANCDKFHKVSSGDQCDSIETEFKITHDQFIKWNPSINSGCTNLQLDYNVCVHVPGAVNTHGPTPQMPNLTTDCKKYHKVTDGESCPEIQKEAGGITLAQFRKWNPTVDAKCSVLVHYRDITEGRQNPVFMSESSPISSAFSPSPRSYSTQHTGSTVIASESYELYQNQSSPGEICSDAVINNSGTSDTTGRTEEAISSPGLEMSQALRRLEEQLSLNDDSFKEIDPLYADAINDDSSFIQMQGNSNGLLLQHRSGESSECHHQDLTQDSDMWKDMLDDYGVSAAAESQTKYLHKLDENAMLQISSERCAIETYGSYKWPYFSDKEAPTAQVPDFKQLEDFKYPTYPPDINTFGSNPDKYTTLFDQDHIGTSLEDEVSLTIAQKQKFTIRDISPDWGYSSEATKVVIIGSFLCNPSECTWTCMFGDIEVPVQIIQEGVICCQAPRHLPGKVTLCVTSGNRESCSEVREFEYRVEPDDCARNNQPDVVGAYQSSEELLLLVRFVQLLLSDLSVQKGDSSELANDFLEKSKANEDSWSQVIESLLFGTSTSMITIDWLLQELLKDKFQQWLYCKLQQKDNQIGCSLSKKEQGIIHMVAGLGYEWALHPILNAGLSVNFRDINGWTALHWAARFGREKMVASLIASGASAGAVTDPSSRDPVGKTAASIASSCGHKGLAGYLSEVALTSHLSSLTLEQSELSKGTADVEAERTISSISNTSATINEDQRSLKDTLAAVRNAAQAAARIQSAFRAHSFRKRQLRESVVSATTSGDEYGVLSNDIHGLSAASKLAFRNTRDYNSAALAIQKKYRGWKGRKDFLAFRQKVVKIQAHVRGYQVRKQYKVCWAVGILEKVVLRWRRRGVGLRGFRHDIESIDESEDEDILKVFRKQKVDAALDEAVSRVLSMVESPGARQQYHRILEKYRQAKAELEGADSETASTAHGYMSNMENDDIPVP